MEKYDLKESKRVSGVTPHCMNSAGKMSKWELQVFF
jgi:hypothetical protein